MAVSSDGYPVTYPTDVAFSFPTRTHVTLPDISVNVPGMQRCIRSAKQSLTLDPDGLSPATL